MKKYPLGRQPNSSSRILESDYRHPEALASVKWLAEHLDNPEVKIIEVNVDHSTYDSGHIPGAVSFDWKADLQDPLVRDILSKEAFEKLVGGAGISPDDTVVLYGDHSNWFAAYGFWLFTYFGHEKVKLLNGGRTKWLMQQELKFVKEKPSPVRVPYEVHKINQNIRIRLPDLLDPTQEVFSLIDVRNREEFSGRVKAPQGVAISVQRGGHIPGALNVPWCAAVADDGTFISVNRLRRLYLGRKKLDPSKPTVTYCRIGERSSHTWFVFKYLIGFENVRNYDGSWTEYGNCIGLPIEVGN